MFTRRVSMHLKPNSVAEFTRTIEKDILPLLRKQKGFQDEITFIGMTGTEAFGISLWDTAEPRLKPMRLPTRRSTRSPLQ